jgi:LPXTG-motif cell wall-anchored protein
VSLSRRATGVARVLGASAAAAALSIAAAQTALACSIGDFSAAPACDSSGKPVIRVTDKDASGTPATVTLKIELSMPGGERDVDSATIGHPTGQGVSVDLHPLEWHAGETFVVHVKAGRVDEDLKPPVVVPEDATCTPSATPTPSASTTPATHPSSAPSATPSPAQSSSTAASPVASSAPSPAGGGTHLAETGASGTTPVIAGTAAALVVAGGGLVLALRRKAARRAG